MVTCTFSELSLVHWQGRLTVTTAMSNSANVKLTQVAMVDNMIDKCPVNRDRLCQLNVSCNASMQTLVFIY